MKAMTLSISSIVLESHPQKQASVHATDMLDYKSGIVVTVMLLRMPAGVLHSHLVAPVVDLVTDVRGTQPWQQVVYGQLQRTSIIVGLGRKDDTDLVAQRLELLPNTCPAQTHVLRMRSLSGHILAHLCCIQRDDAPPPVRPLHRPRAASTGKYQQAATGKAAPSSSRRRQRPKPTLPSSDHPSCPALSANPGRVMSHSLSYNLLHVCVQVIRNMYDVCASHMMPPNKWDLCTCGTHQLQWRPAVTT